MQVGTIAGAHGSRQLFLWLCLYAVVGLPIAMWISFFAGGPALDQAITARKDRLPDAAFAGARVGAIVGLASLTLTAAIGVWYRLDYQASVNSYMYGRQTVLDGMPTLLGWMLKLGGFLMSVAIGSASGSAGWLAAMLWPSPEQ